MEGRCGTRYYFPPDAPPFSVTYGGYSSGGRRQPRHVISSDGRFKDAHETYGPLVTIFHDRGVSLDFLLRQRDVFEKCPVKCTAPKSRRRRKQTDLLGRRNRMGKRDIAARSFSRILISNAQFTNYYTCSVKIYCSYCINDV